MNQIDEKENILYRPQLEPGRKYDSDASFEHRKRKEPDITPYIPEEKVVEKLQKDMKELKRILTTVPDVGVILNPTIEKLITRSKIAFPDGEAPQKTILLCLRNDRERLFRSKEELVNTLNSCGYRIQEMDINVERYVAWENGFYLVRYFCREFQKYSAVVTDRLHGMILSVICDVPCVAFDNKTQKVSGVFEHFKSKGYVSLVSESDVENIVDIIETTLRKKKNAGSYVVPENDFRLMAEIIESKVKKEL